MSDEQIIEAASAWLGRRKIAFVPPGKISGRNKQCADVRFLVPEALDPDAVVDPPDIYVRVNLQSNEVTLLPQM
jgi:hypothetical protein